MNWRSLPHRIGSGQRLPGYEQGHGEGDARERSRALSAENLAHLLPHPCRLRGKHGRGVGRLHHPAPGAHFRGKLAASPSCVARENPDPQATVPFPEHPSDVGQIRSELNLADDGPRPWTGPARADQRPPMPAAAHAGLIQPPPPAVLGVSDPEMAEWVRKRYGWPRPVSARLTNNSKLPTDLRLARRFNDKTAADALVPRLDVVYVHPDESIPRLIQVSLETGFSRFPVCGSDLDDVVGVAAPGRLPGAGNVRPPRHRRQARRAEPGRRVARRPAGLRPGARRGSS